MSQAFIFGFDNKDIEEDGLEEVSGNLKNENNENSNTTQTEPQLHTLDELLSTLPSSISYGTIKLQGRDGRTYNLPRRDLFDIRAQLMAEDTFMGESSIAGLSTDDITPQVYEGGFKTWECSVDLASYVSTALDISGHGCDLHVIELGAGSALPSLLLFQNWLNQPASGPTMPCSLKLSLADYNQSVLGLATIPNLFLTWCTTQQQSSSNEIDITPELMQTFRNDLHARNISISEISGAWGPAFTELIPPIRQRGPATNSINIPNRTLVLASETIYSPPSIRDFTSILLNVIAKAQSSGSSTTALVAAKRVYFGVGGGVDEFLRVLEEMGGKGSIVWETEGAGVGRVILEVVASGR